MLQENTDLLQPSWFSRYRTRAPEDWLHQGLTVLQDWLTCKQPWSREGFHSSWKSQNQTFRLWVQGSWVRERERECVCVCLCVCLCVCVSVAQSCPTLCDPMDCSPPGSSVHRILQARILEWVAKSFSRGSSTWQADSLPFEPPGKIFLQCYRSKPEALKQWQQTLRATEKWGLALEKKKCTDWGKQCAHMLRVQKHKEKWKGSMQYYEKTQNFKEELWTGVGKVGNTIS